MAARANANTLHQQSQEFMNALNNVLEIIEELQPNDIQYLNACNSLKKINDLKREMGVFQNNPVVRQHQRRARQENPRQRIVRTDVEKMRQGAKRCAICDRVVFCMPQHKSSLVCRQVQISKGLSVKIKKTEIARYITIIQKINVWASKYDYDKYY